jgi:hypothetical protein
LAEAEWKYSLCEATHNVVSTTVESVGPYGYNYLVPMAGPAMSCVKNISVNMFGPNMGYKSVILADAVGRMGCIRHDWTWLGPDVYNIGYGIGMSADKDGPTQKWDVPGYMKPSIHDWAQMKLVQTRVLGSGWAHLVDTMTTPRIHYGPPGSGMCQDI